MFDDAKAFAENAGFDLNDYEQLQLALTHSSWSYEHTQSAAKCNERLEFLGDSVLQLMITGELFLLNDKLAEGKMSKIRSLLVCEETLASLARKVNLGAYLRLGHGEDLTGGREKNSNLSDAFEAVIGAMYLDKGFSSVYSWLKGLIDPYLELALSGKLIYDYKSVLLEHLQAVLPSARTQFKIIDECGPVHDRIFTAAFSLNDKELTQGSGKSKKEAEQVASAKALEILENMNA